MPAVLQLGAITDKNPLWEKCLRHTYKFGDAALITANAGQLISHDRIDNALHGSEYQTGLQGRGVCHGRQGNDIANFLTVGVTPTVALCRLALSGLPLRNTSLV